MAPHSGFDDANRASNNNAPTQSASITPASQERSANNLIIGHIDSGIDYRRADFANFLIYRDKTNFKGRDFWDNDSFPMIQIPVETHFFRNHTEVMCLIS